MLHRIVERLAGDHQDIVFGRRIQRGRFAGCLADDGDAGFNAHLLGHLAEHRSNSGTRRLMAEIPHRAPGFVDGGAHLVPCKFEQLALRFGRALAEGERSFE